LPPSTPTPSLALSLAPLPATKESEANAREGLLHSPPSTPTRTYVLAIALFTLITVFLWSHVWITGNPAHAITCNCGDTVQQVWWFEWLPWAVVHGHNPLLSMKLFSRMGGVNVLSNTSWLLPAAVLSPITLLWGPVASFNVANLLAPILSGWAAFALAGWFSRRTVSRLVAAGLFAFSPFFMHNTVLGHLDLTLTAYLPLTFLLVLRLLSRDGRPVRIGILLGTLTILQFFVSLEVLAITAVTGALGVAGVWVFRSELFSAARQRLMTAAVVSSAMTAVVLAYPVWFYLFGPRHVDGPFWPVGPGKWWGLFFPGANFQNGLQRLATVGYLGARGADTDYLGVGVLLVLVISWPLLRRRRTYWVLAGMAVACWLLEWCPAVVWSKLPILSSIDEPRFALPLSLCVGLLTAIAIDAWWTRASTVSDEHADRRRWARVGVVVLFVVALIPLFGTYSIPFRVGTDTVPTWFTHEASAVPAGTAVLTIPFAYDISSRPMGWQAEVHDDFDLVGGWAFIPGHNGLSDQIVSHLGGGVDALNALSLDPGCVSAQQQQSIRVSILRWRPLVIVEIPTYALPGSLDAVTDTLGIPPTFQDGSWVWRLSASSTLGPVTPIPTLSSCVATSV
jgi:hypothetical protein